MAKSTTTTTTETVSRTSSEIASDKLAELLAENADLKAQLAAKVPAKPANLGGESVTYDWDAIEKQQLGTDKLPKGARFNRARYLIENNLPNPTRKYRVEASGPAEIQPITVYAVDQSDACYQLRMGNSHIGNGNAHRYNVRAVLAV